MIGKKYPVFIAVAFGLMSQFSAQAQTCTAVDAITTSTLKLTNESKACESTADLVFTYTKTNGSRPFSYGKTTSYGTDGGNISGSTRTTTIKLTGLDSGTKYYFKVEGIYEDAGGLQYTMTGSFTTDKSAGVVNTYKTTPKTIINIGKNMVAIPVCSDNVLNIQIFSVNGALVFKQDVKVVNQVGSVPAGLFNSNGTYLCKITGATTSQKQAFTILK